VSPRVNTTGRKSHHTVEAFPEALAMTIPPSPGGGNLALVAIRPPFLKSYIRADRHGCAVKYLEPREANMRRSSHQQMTGKFSEAKCEACADHFSCSWRLFYERKPCPVIPWHVWIATGLLAADAVFSVFRLFGAQSLLEGAITTVLSIACIVGLASRAKWAYGLALLFAAAGLVLGLAGHLSPAAIVINGMIVLLLAPAFRVYFPKRSEPAQDFLDRMPPSSDVPPPME